MRRIKRFLRPDQAEELVPNCRVMVLPSVKDKGKTMYAKLETLRSHIASGNIECVYVWITKEEDTDEACFYRFDAEIYARGGEQDERLQPVKSESGLMKVDKAMATGSLIGDKEDSLARSIGARILLELKGMWRKGEFPNAKFLTYCNIGRESLFMSSTPAALLSVVPSP
jgi:hypothetical protein